MWSSNRGVVVAVGEHDCVREYLNCSSTLPIRVFANKQTIKQVPSHSEFLSLSQPKPNLFPRKKFLHHVCIHRPKPLPHCQRPRQWLLQIGARRRQVRQRDSCANLVRAVPSNSQILDQLLTDVLSNYDKHVNGEWVIASVGVGTSGKEEYLIINRASRTYLIAPGELFLGASDAFLESTC